MQEETYYTGPNAYKAYASQGITEENILVSKSYNRTFENFEPNTSVRSEYIRQDYDYFRPNESLPQCVEEEIALSLKFYKKNGIVHNVVDLMADFSVQGIRFQHPNPAINRFYKKLAKKLKVKNRSERIVNMLLKAGNVLIKKSYAKVPAKIEQKWKQGKGSDLKLETPNIKSKEIPIRYTIFNPLSIEVIGKELSQFIDKPLYALKIPTAIKINSPLRSTLTKEYESLLLNNVPADIKEILSNNKSHILLDSNKVEVLSYKKDDGEVWASPLIGPIIPDLLQLEKYKLADLSALDGAISNIRLWRLGIIGQSLQDSLLPTKAQIDKLRSILSKNTSGGVLELVWGPELDFKESNSQVWRFLGSEKYIAVLNAINDGLGLPPTLRSNSNKSNNTGNYVGLNTMIKRLQYIRDILIDFWEKELAEIHAAMGFISKPPEIIFDFMVFADESAEKQLWINLYDRNLISAETIQEVFNRYPDFEKMRIKKEFRDMDKGTYPDKAGPFHNGDKDHELKKILLQGGTVTPSEVGVTLYDKKPGEKLPIKIKEENMPEKKPFSNIPGRPNNIIETKKRKKKPLKPSTKAAISSWAYTAYNMISEYVNDIMLKTLNKENMRQISSKDADSIEQIKYLVLCNINPFSSITLEMVYDILTSNKCMNKMAIEEYLYAKNDYINLVKKDPSISENRMLYISSYINLQENLEE